MADNVAISAGSGTNIATDEVTTTLEHVQLFKLAYSADGSRALVLADASGLSVQGTVTANLAAGTNNIGDVDVISVPALTKGTQGATGFSVQNLKDAGRNQVTHYTETHQVTTSADVLMTLAGYKSGAAVTGTTTPAVVTTGKTLRLIAMQLTYISLASAGGAKVRLRANTAGVVAVGSPIVKSFTIGSTAAVAGINTVSNITFPDGVEFAAGTGIGITIVGYNTTGGALAAGYVQVMISGYEY